MDKLAEQFETQLTIEEVQAMLSSDAIAADKNSLRPLIQQSSWFLYIFITKQKNTWFLWFCPALRRRWRCVGFRVQNALCRKDDQSYVIFVKDHKTSLEGPAPIVVTKELYGLMKKYYEEFCPVAVADKDYGHFSLARNGGQL